MSKRLSFLGIVLIFLGVVLMAYSQTTRESSVIGGVVGEGGTAENPQLRQIFQKEIGLTFFYLPGLRGLWSLC